MNISGILVMVPPGQTETIIERLNALPGMEVYHGETETGRVVVIQEAESVEEEIAGLTRIEALSGVMSAKPIYHYLGEALPTWQTVPEAFNNL